VGIERRLTDNEGEESSSRLQDHTDLRNYKQHAIAARISSVKQQLSRYRHAGDKGEREYITATHSCRRL